MVFPRDPRDTVVELFVDGGWVDITAAGDVYGREPLVITSGRADESQNFAPAACGFTLNNRTGQYNPRNPLSTYYGKIGRNTPMRVRIRTARDQFDRTVVNGWGTASTGQAYSLVGAGGTVQNSDYQVSGGFATHSVPATNAYRASYFPFSVIRHRNVDTAVTVSLPFTNVTGARIEIANFMFHISNTPDYYLIRAFITTTESVQILVLDPSGSQVGDVATVLGLTHSSGQPLRARAQCDGRYFRAKVWAATGPEPFGWDLVTQHDGIVAGGVGIRSGVASGNTNTLPIVFSYSDLHVSVPRFAGEVGTWNQVWNAGLADALTVVEAADVLRRLGQGSGASSALRQEIPLHSPDAFWPLEDGPLTRAGRPIIGAPQMVITGDTDPSRQWGQGQIASWLPNVVSRQGVGELSVSGISQPSFVSDWSVTWVMAGGRAHNDVLIIGASPSLTIAPWVWKVEFSLTANDIQVTTPSAAIFGNTHPKLFDGAVHHVTLDVPGHNTTSFRLSVDGLEVVGGGFSASGTPQSVAEIRFRNLVDPGSEVLMIGYLKVASVATITSINPEVDAALGWVGETAGDRISRICTQLSVPFTYVGSPLTLPVGGSIGSATMGPQYVDSPMAVIGECVLVDMGEIYAPRGTMGIEYRTLQSLYKQAASLTLDFSADHLAPPLVPIDDDQLTRNRVDATRRNGGSYVAELSSGPLSTADPVNGGVGIYENAVSVNVETDDQVQHAAGWLLHLGTFDGARYPQITVSLGRPAIANSVAMANAAMDVNLGDRIVITNATAIGVYDDISVIVRGIKESIDAFEHLITFNCTPEAPYHIMVWDDASSRWDSDNSTLAAQLNSGVTGSISVTVANSDLWTTDGAQFPINFRLGGEVITVSGISGASSPQTFTVSVRGVNGVNKTHPASTSISLADPVYWGM